MTEHIQENSEEAPKVPKEITLNDTELASLLATDPEDPTLQEWMVAKGLKFGDDIVVHGEDRPDTIYTTRQDDFMTRNREATSTWNKLLSEEPEAPEVIASKNILGLPEQEIESKKEAELEEIQGEMGEVALEDAEIEDPEETETKPEVNTDRVKLEQLVSDARRQYEYQVEQSRELASREMKKGVGRIDEAKNAVNRANITIDSLEDNRTDFLRIASNVEAGNYGPVQVRQQLDELSQVLQSKFRTIPRDLGPNMQDATNNLANALGGVRFELEQKDRSFNVVVDTVTQRDAEATRDTKQADSEASSTAIKAVTTPLETLLQATRDVDGEVSGNAQVLQVIIRQVEELKQTSLSGQVDVEGLRRIAAQLANMSGSRNRSVFTSFNASASEAMSTLNASASKLQVE